jgi:hypothetical protein
VGVLPADVRVLKGGDDVPGAAESYLISVLLIPRMVGWDMCGKYKVVILQQAPKNHFFEMWTTGVC